jgi:hypothetical protein
MTDFPLHTIESTPERAKPALKQLQAAFGVLPNIVGKMATSPVLSARSSLADSARRPCHGGNASAPELRSGIPSGRLRGRR